MMNLTSSVYRLPKSEFQNSRIPEFHENSGRGGVEEHVGEISSSSFGKKIFSSPKNFPEKRKENFKVLAPIFTSSNLNPPPSQNENSRIPSQNSCESSPIEPCTVHSSFEICIQKYMFSDRTGPDQTGHAGIITDTTPRPTLKHSSKSISFQKIARRIW